MNPDLKDEFFEGALSRPMNPEKKKAAPDDSNIGSDKQKTGGTIYHASTVYDTAVTRKLQEETHGGDISLEELPEDELEELFGAVLDILPWQTVDGAETLTDLAGGKVFYEALDCNGYRFEQYVDNDGFLWLRRWPDGRIEFYKLPEGRNYPDDCPSFLEWLDKYKPDQEVQFVGDTAIYDTGEYSGSLETILKALRSDLIDAEYKDKDYTVYEVVDALNKAQPDGITDFQLMAVAVAYSLYKAQNGIRGEGCVWRK